MGILKVKVESIFDALSQPDLAALRDEIEHANSLLHSGKGMGSDFRGWIDLPEEITPAHLQTLKEAAKALCEKSEIIVIVGIGGSYLGTKAVLDALSPHFYALHKHRPEPLLVFMGQQMDEDYTTELLHVLQDYSVGVIVISKSGTTLEPAIAFRLLRADLERRYGKFDAATRIYAVTDPVQGALRKLATQEGYRTFPIPSNVGGRFSVLTPGGLLPLAAAGIDISEIVRGAREMQHATAPEVPFTQNPAALYAAARIALYRSGKKIELLASYDPKLNYFSEWWKQLFAESEGKNGQGIFPASAILTTDLHSIGQYIQEGERILFETVIQIDLPHSNQNIPADPQNLDELNFVAGKRLSEVNRMAELGTTLAHEAGGVPNIHISIPELTPYTIGALLYFFEKSCAISGYTLGINPFDQPGVEAYKKNMLALLGKPGYENQLSAIQENIS